LKNRGLDTAFRNLYGGVDMQLAQVNKTPPGPPSFPSETLTVFDQIASEGTVDLQPGDPFPAGTTAASGLELNYAGQSTDGGHYWELKGDYDARGAELRVDYSVTTTPQVFKIVLRDINDVILGTFSVNADASPGIHTAVFQIPAAAAFQAVRRVHVIVEPTQTGVQTADFFVHQIQFRRFNGPDPLLTGADVTVLPPAPAVDPLSGNGGTVARKYYNTTTIDLTYDVSAQPDSYAGTTIHYDDFLTPTKEFADLSAGDSFVFGLSGPAGSKIKFEVVDASGNVGTIILSSLSSTVQYYRIKKSDLAGAVDLHHVSEIHFVTDQTLAGGNNTGVIHIVTEGLKPSNLVLPDPALTLSNVTILPKPIVGGVSGGGGLLPNNTVTTLNASGTTDTVAFDYDISGGGFAGALLQYDNPTTTKIEVKDLSKISNFVFGITAPTGAGQIKLEFKDATNNLVTLYLQYAGPGEQFYKIPVSYISGVNLTQITQINFIVDDIVTLVDTGTISVRTDGL
jgi:hypothetical protein